MNDEEGTQKQRHGLKYDSVAFFKWEGKRERGPLRGCVWLLTLEAAVGHPSQPRVVEGPYIQTMRIKRSKGPATLLH